MRRAFTTLRAPAHVGVVFGAALIGFAVEDVRLVPTILDIGVIDGTAAVGWGSIRRSIGW